MDSRRAFLKQASLLVGGSGLWEMLPDSLKKAMSIDPEKGTTFYDAEHVVFLMQENRSFDHALGHLQGVRGYNDPRAIDLPDKNKVWLQTNEKGETYAPFHLDMHGTRATWMGSLHHNWWDMVDARNQGKHDKWLFAKKSPHKQFEEMPLTMGYYNRADIPFYYAFADAFTVCDQHFCSCLTGTTANRSYFWSGRIRDPQPGAPARVRNSDIGYSKEVDWKTFPERLEENDISWKVYQNELSIETELEGEASSLLSNFTNNNLEWFKQYNVRFSRGHYQFLVKKEQELKKNVAALKLRQRETPDDQELNKELEKQIKEWEHIQEQKEKWSPENFRKLDPFLQSIHQKAFTDNHGDPHYHEIEEVTYADHEGNDKTFHVPKGDIFHQFRKDVRSGELPTVSWLVAPQRFSDHPSSAWFGAWYVSEALNILTEDPEVWKKTIFILNYDENDGYFDHVPPYAAPNPQDISTGKTSSGIDSAEEFVTLEEELAKPGMDPENARENSTGLGYRVPLIIASPWSRGGWVNSEICDITSTLMFLETFLNKKFNLNIREENINSWRRAICGDLTSAFRPYNGEKIEFPEMLDRNSFMKTIREARDKDLPGNFHAMGPAEIEEFNRNPEKSPFMPQQEKGIRNSNALPYELLVTEDLQPDQGLFSLTFEAGHKIFGKKSLGAAFNVFAPGKFRQPNENGEMELLPVKFWSFATEAGDRVRYDWKLDDFEDSEYHLQVHSANGFYREYRGNSANHVSVNASYHITEESKDAHLKLSLTNRNTKDSAECMISNQVYDDVTQMKTLKPGESISFTIPVHRSYNWYDLEIKIKGDENYLRKLAGRVENGLPSKTDPLMGDVL